jgi:tetratricopeptide (TPR) repeat protein
MTDMQLDTLEARGLIRIATVQPELEYLFRHALLQDTAYESLLKQERRALHLVVGETIEELYPDRLGELAAVLAMHFEQAGDTEKAIEYLSAAAQFASDRNAIVEAHDLFTRAAALLAERTDTDDDSLRRRRVEIQLGRAKAGFSFMSKDDALRVLEPIVADAGRLNDLRLEADVHLTLALLRQLGGERPDTSPELKRSLERVSEIAVELGDPLIAALPDSIVGLVRVFTGDMRGGVALLERTAPQLEQKHDFVGSSFALVALAIGYSRLGDFARADDAAKRARALAEHGDLIAKLDSLIGESWVNSVRGDLEAAVPLATQCTNLAEETGAIACVVSSNFVLGDAYMRLGKFGDAKIAFERGNEVANAIQQRQFRPSITAYMRSNAAHMGEFGPNAGTFEEALTEAQELGDRWGEANVIWQRADTEAKHGAGANADRMLADYATAAAEFEDMGARPFLARALRGWGNALRSLGRFDEGDEKLRRALELFDELGIPREADEVREALSAA